MLNDAVSHSVTNYMDQNTALEAVSLSASQIPRFLWYPNVHYRIHKCPPPVPLLSQINPIYASHHASLKSVLILSSHLCPGLTRGLGSPHYNPISIFPLTGSCHMPNSSHSSWFYHPSNIRRGAYIIKLFIMQFVCLLLPRPT